MRPSPHGTRRPPESVVVNRFIPIWRSRSGKPLVSYLVIVQLIATTGTGLTFACRLDENDYEKGIKVTDTEMSALNIQPAAFHREWNYTIAPRRPHG
jgi:hypothetical protein